MEQAKNTFINKYLLMVLFWALLSGICALFLHSMLFIFSYIAALIH
jgi:hypothetical protein